MMISKESIEMMYKEVQRLRNPNGCFNVMLNMPTWALCCEENMPQLAQEYLFMKSTFTFMKKFKMAYFMGYDEYLDKIEPSVLEYLAKKP